MTLSKEVVVPGMLDEYRRFSDLARELSPDEWSAPSRCTGWSAADVAAHVTGQLDDVVNFRLDGIGTPEVTARQVTERRGRTGAEVADELDVGLESARAIAIAFDDATWNSPGPSGTIGDGIEALWFDTFLHADDILAESSRPTRRQSGVAASLSHVASVLTTQDWGPADLGFAGYDLFPVSGGGGRVIDGDPVAFILCATGRGDPSQFGLDDSVNIYR